MNDLVLVIVVVGALFFGRNLISRIFMTNPLILAAVLAVALILMLGFTPGS